MATTRLTAPNGAKVTVDKSKVDGLLSRGFTEESAKTTTKKSSSSKSSK
jgi:hypothetical protein